MDAALLIRQFQALRESWVEVAPGKRVKIRRPGEAEIPGFFAAVPIDRVKAHVVDWEGFTEADLLGSELAPREPVLFDKALWAEVVSDRAVWFKPAHNALCEAINQHKFSIDVTEKN